MLCKHVFHVFKLKTYRGDQIPFLFFSPWQDWKMPDATLRVKVSPGWNSVAGTVDGMGGAFPVLHRKPS